MLDLWAVGIYDLGLSEEQFLRLTMKELDALCKRKKQNDRRIESHSALVACMIHNTHCGPKNVLDIDDFMTTKEPKQSKPQTAQEMQNAARMITAALGGEFK